MKNNVLYTETLEKFNELSSMQMDFYRMLIRYLTQTIEWYKLNYEPKVRLNNSK